MSDRSVMPPSPYIIREFNDRGTLWLLEDPTALRSSSVFWMRPWPKTWTLPTHNASTAVSLRRTSKSWRAI